VAVSHHDATPTSGELEHHIPGRSWEDGSFDGMRRDGTITGIVDWNVPFPAAMQGDRGFDIARLAFYS